MVATNVYQTSSSAEPLQPDCDCVAPKVVPVVDVVQVVEGFTVKDVEPAQLSFDGVDGVVTQMLKVPCPDPLALLCTLT